jgi:hypothetical protein
MYPSWYPKPPGSANYLFLQGVGPAKAAHSLALEGPQLSVTPGDDVTALLAPGCAQVLGFLESFALDPLEA